MRLTSSLAFAGLLASAAATFVTFEPSVTLYASAGNATCSNQPSVTLTGIQNCVAYKPTTSGAVAYYVKSAACDFDNKVVGLSFYAASDSQCTGATLGSKGDVVMERCSQLSGPLSGVQVMYTCPSTPCCQTTAVVVSMSVLLAVGGVLLCVYWVVKDMKAKKHLLAEGKAMEASVAAEKERNARVQGLAFTGNAPYMAGAGASGYSALPH